MLKYSNHSFFDASVMFRRKHDKQELPLGIIGGSDNSSSGSGTTKKTNMSNPVGYPSKAARPTESCQLVPKNSGYERLPLAFGSVLNHSTSKTALSPQSSPAKQSTDADVYILLF